ncbi:MAG: hypothetical protein R6U58_06315 [Bacteroidales bacterium]
MTTFESPVRTIFAKRKAVYEFLSDMGNFDNLVPDGRVRNFEVEKERCRFIVDGLGEVSIRLSSGKPYDTIVFESEGKTPVYFDLLVELDEAGEQSTKMKLTLRAELNMMLKMIAIKPIEEGLEMATSKLSDHLNSLDWD